MRMSWGISLSELATAVGVELGGAGLAGVEVSLDTAEVAGVAGLEGPVLGAAGLDAADHCARVGESFSSAQPER